MPKRETQGGCPPSSDHPPPCKFQTPAAPAAGWLRSSPAKTPQRKHELCILGKGCGVSVTFSGSSQRLFQPCWEARAALEALIRPWHLVAAATAACNSPAAFLRFDKRPHLGRKLRQKLPLHRACFSSFQIEMGSGRNSKDYANLLKINSKTYLSHSFPETPKAFL